MSRGQHYSSNTVSITAYCNKCGKQTPHQVSGHKKGACIPCVEKLEEDHKKRAAQPRAPEQKGLF